MLLYIITRFMKNYCHLGDRTRDVRSEQYFSCFSIFYNTDVSHFSLNSNDPYLILLSQLLEFNGETDSKLFKR